MQIRNDSLPPLFAQADVFKLLKIYRAQRDFKPANYVQEKTDLIVEYFQRHGLNAVVLGVSGGIDSAVTLGILVEVSKKIPLKILPLLMPVKKTDGATNQEHATYRGEEVCLHFQLSAKILELGIPFDFLRAAVEIATGLGANPWARGQLVSYLRTPALYYATSLLAVNGYRGVVAGTTNLDEGAYLGYFGKASDGMVDIQLISDIHKYEVNLVGQYFRLPESVLSAIPTGDMFDAKSDEEVFGVCYGTVELYYFWKTQPAQFNKALELAQLDFDLLIPYFDKVQAMHDYNKHKYLAFSPAIHLDVYSFTNPGGWQYAKFGT